MSAALPRIRVNASVIGDRQWLHGLSASTQQIAVCPDSPTSGPLAGPRSPERDPSLHSLMEKQLTGTCACSSAPIAAQTVTDGLSETEDALVT